ncbi:hypothetical protein I7I51_06491 [Histoplasma capsulatum]|uniref:Uncharacterized protein n=1 Tax=Ajellomyces capsulatus TaxID=5037 RepID=A0A8A1MIF7_AJECA|nr:hypothetical protein I7I51_06491 [Histoplasma capsulatum]
MTGHIQEDHIHGFRQARLQTARPTFIRHIRETFQSPRAMTRRLCLPPASYSQGAKIPSGITGNGIHAFLVVAVLCHRVSHYPADMQETPVGLCTASHGLLPARK